MTSTQATEYAKNALRIMRKTQAGQYSHRMEASNLSVIENCVWAVQTAAHVLGMRTSSLVKQIEGPTASWRSEWE